MRRIVAVILVDSCIITDLAAPESDWFEWKEASFLAGKAFLQYRNNQGQKGNVLPDFFIGAHAAVFGYQLITRERGDGTAPVFRALS